jgi:flagellar hook-associated protein 2
MANGGTLKLDKLLNASDGVVTRLNSYIKPYLDFNGNIDARTRSLNDQLKKISTSRTEQDDRLTKLQSNLSRQFQAMDSLVAGYNSTTSYLSSFINASK